MTREEEGRAIVASLARENEFFRKWDERERHGSCPDHPSEVRGRCPKCEEVDRG
jgi:hypothetical protein